MMRLLNSLRGGGDLSVFLVKNDYNTHLHLRSSNALLESLRSQSSVDTRYRCMKVKSYKR